MSEFGKSAIEEMMMHRWASVTLDKFLIPKEFPNAQRHRAVRLIRDNGLWKNVATSESRGIACEEDLLAMYHLLSAFRKEHEAQGHRVWLHGGEDGEFFMTAEEFIPATEEQLQEAREILAQPDPLAQLTLTWRRPIPFNTEN